MIIKNSYPMKNLLLILFLALAVAACEKNEEKTYCWYCISTMYYFDDDGDRIGNAIKDTMEYCNKTGKDMLDVRDQVEYDKLVYYPPYNANVRGKKTLMCAKDKKSSFLSWELIEKQ